MGLDLETQVQWMLVEHVKRGTDTDGLARGIIAEVRARVIEEVTERFGSLLRGEYANQYHTHDPTDID